jgi:hypothetical protein
VDDRRVGAATDDSAATDDGASADDSAPGGHHGANRDDHERPAGPDDRHERTLLVLGQ